MNLLLLVFFSLILSLVPFSVALSSSVYRCIVWKEAVKIAFVFAVFQAGMMAIGWLIGFSVKRLLYDMAIPVAVLIILFIGFRMFMDSRRLDKQSRIMAVEDRKILLGFALVISINTALLGMGIGILYEEILALCCFIISIVFLMSILGIQLGKRGLVNLGRTLEMVGGLGLFAICAIIVLQYLKII